MTIELDKKTLIILIKGTGCSYTAFNNQLVTKAGHSYSDCYGTTSWSSLDELTELELYELYLICKNSWE